jgi:hypothetical protein
MTRNKKWFPSLTPLSHKEYVTFGDDKKDKVLCTGIIKVNDFFTLNNVTLVDRLRYNLLSVSQLVDANLSVLFTSLIRMFLPLLASVFVASLALQMFFKLISHLPNLLWSAWFCNLLPSSGSGIRDYVIWVLICYVDSVA